MHRELDLDCFLYSVSQEEKIREYLLSCNYGNSDQIEFKNVKELLNVYRTTVAIEATKYYPEVIKQNKNSAIVIGIRNNGKINACFRLRPTGNISDSWYSGADVLCE